jgi:hypothetical protein
MPAAALTEQQKQFDQREETNSTFASRARETMGDAAAAVRHTFQHATEPLTHAQQKKTEKKAAEEEQYQQCEETCLHEQHEAALKMFPSMHDKTKIHFMMEATHNENFVPNPCDKEQRKPVEAPCANKGALEAVKEVFKGKTEDRVTKDCLLQQHRAAVECPSACDKTKFAFI